MQYYTGTAGTCKENETDYDIDYRDGSKECLDLGNEIWSCSSPDTMSTSLLQVCNVSFESSRKDVVQAVIEVLGYKSCIICQARGSSTISLVNACAREEPEFKKNVKLHLVPISKVPETAHITTNHVANKVKPNDVTSHKM